MMMRAVFLAPALLVTRHVPLGVRMSDEPPTAPNWFVEPPGTFEAMASQASRSVLAARSQRQRLIVEASAPELDPASPSHRKQELVNFAHDVGQPLLSGLPVSKPHVKLLFSTFADAALAGASIMTTSLPVAMLGTPTAVGPRDGAFIIVAPTSSDEIDVERAVSDLLQIAGGRLVILINPRVGNAPFLSTFEQAYLMRPLSVGYLRDQLADQIERVPACLLRCYPHEYSVLMVEPGGDARERASASWRYAGRFKQQPQADEIERLLQDEMTKARNEAMRSPPP